MKVHIKILNINTYFLYCLKQTTYNNNTIACILSHVSSNLSHGNQIRNYYIKFLKSLSTVLVEILSITVE
jgi:hypothetical protein